MARFAFAIGRLYDRRPPAWHGIEEGKRCDVMHRAPWMNDHVVVIGGGVMGSALAYWLTRLDPASKVTVVERDPSYEYASSALSAASIRQQFSTPVNIRISQASIAFLRKAADELESGGERPDIVLHEAGYLY